ncbi:hypothetical protein EmuJ_000215700 [Echinococcus multilocularis]|uniref:Uncharacterized protein n=1 Tax=Echinococcus multilocularis TaxID=6211 RepID=A0A087W1I1_ECHMU|nr:hypothetical protein EmuJ_000215700 [Echinococcus multilocularis]
MCVWASQYLGPNILLPPNHADTSALENVTSALRHDLQPMLVVSRLLPILVISDLPRHFGLLRLQGRPVMRHSWQWQANPIQVNNYPRIDG